jgi:hypothetical protein
MSVLNRRLCFCSLLLCNICIVKSCQLLNFVFLCSVMYVGELFYIPVRNTYIDTEVCRKWEVVDGVFCNPCVVTSGLSMFFRVILK